MDNFSKDFLLKLYRSMLRIRCFEESLIEPILNGAIKGPCHLATGQEAIAAGVCAALPDNSYAFGNHRSHSHYLAKGGDMNALMAEIYGKETGCSKGRGGSMHLCDPAVGFMGSVPIVAGTISLALGTSLASKMRDEKQITVVFFGDGAVGEGVLYESLNFAALKKLSIIFVCENNGYATHMPISECRPKDTKITEIAGALHIMNNQVDGNDVLRVYETAKDFVEFCRRDAGPCFIECLTYRLRGHVGPDDNIQGNHGDIRPKEEVEAWKKKDPVKNFRKFLYDKGHDFMTEDSSCSYIRHLEYSVEREVKEAHVFAKESPWPKSEELEKYVYAS